MAVCGERAVSSMSSILSSHMSFAEVVFIGRGFSCGGSGGSLLAYGLHGLAGGGSGGGRGVGVLASLS